MLCKHEKCIKRGVYGNKDDTNRFCSNHKTESMINLQSKRCVFENCEIQTPHFDIEGGKGRFCAKHKTSLMIDVKHATCLYNGCTTQPNFNTKGELKGIYCLAHKLNGMIDVKNKKCIYEGCNKQPNYDIEGGKGKYCVEHKEDSMIDVKHKKCNYDKCNNRPYYNIRGGNPILCIQHKNTDMIDVVHKKCEYNGCDKRPHFNIKGEVHTKFCFKHKSNDMVNITSKRCEYEGCNIIPTYSIKEGGKVKFCKNHKKSNMIDVKHKKCIIDGCNIRPTFNVNGQPPLYCVTHKKDNMVDITRKVCNFTNCFNGAYYGKPGNKISHCTKHREKGMIRRSNGKCLVCKVPAIYGTNFIPKHCEIHKKEDEQNLVEKECISCNLIMVLDKDNKCEYCNPDIFKRNRLAKQIGLMDYLDNNNLNGSSTDTIIDNGVCGKERPDRVFELDDKVVILECDEHQHRERNCLCEQTRMINIGQSFGGLPVYFIRWNPDNYIPENIKKEPESIKNRYKLVGNFIKDIIDNRINLPKALISVIYMYYDNWNYISNENWKLLMLYK